MHLTDKNQCNNRNRGRKRWHICIQQQTLSQFSDLSKLTSFSIRISQKTFFELVFQATSRTSEICASSDTPVVFWHNATLTIRNHHQIQSNQFDWIVLYCWYFVVTILSWLLSIQRKLPIASITTPSQHVTGAIKFISTALALHCTVDSISVPPTPFASVTKMFTS